ncbi:hypothetical protein AOQ84DRAFT_61395 [Glonium stellatum]|uniref:Uncharacterized protein n=1 Tax=Glonium stellatum TaxID=574774 RepID=A0A8E2EYP7_9PEZI|nr:hypothetical protein AOQ84DRAFT_61395 [Glonium stellatum]
MQWIHWEVTIYSVPAVWVRSNLIRKDGTLPGGDPDGLTSGDGWMAGWLRWCGNRGGTWSFLLGVCRRKKKVKSGDSVRREWLEGEKWVAKMGLGCGVVGGQCLKRGMSKPLRHGSGHADSRFETAIPPRASAWNFHHALCPAPGPRRLTLAHTLSLLRTRLFGCDLHRSSAALLGIVVLRSCTAAECQLDALNMV